MRGALALVRRPVEWALTRTVIPCALFALLSAWHAVRQLPSDVPSYRRWINGPLPSWDVPGPYPVLADLVWWPLRWYDGLNPNPIWVLCWTGPATVIACLLLWRTSRYPVPAINTWLVAAAVLERCYWVRLEPIAATITLAAVVAVRGRRPGLSGLGLAIGALIKVWPAFLAPMVFALTRDRRERVRWIVGGAVPCLVFLGAIAVLRPAAPMEWFSFAFGRRIQLESLTALLPLWAMALGSHRWHTMYRGGLDSANLIAGPHLPVIHHALQLAAAAALAVLAWRLLRWWRADRSVARSGAPGVGPVDRDVIVFCSQIVFLLILIFSGPVFSPQYLAWFAPILVVALGQGLMVREAMVWLVACALTNAEYPYLWDDITTPRVHAMAVLTLRDLVLVVLLGLCLQRLWRLTRRGTPGDGDPVVEDAAVAEVA